MRRSILDKRHYGFYKDRPVPDMLFLLIAGISAIAWMMNYRENHGDYKIIVCSSILLFLILYRIFLHRRFFPLRPLVRIDERGITIFTKERSMLIPFENSALVLFGTSSFLRSIYCTVKVVYFNGKIVETDLPVDAQEMDRLENAITQFRPKKIGSDPVIEN